MAEISRDPLELVKQSLSEHQYPDGFILFLGTLFAPIQDRDEPGRGFTHKVGDVVTITSPKLGRLVNRVVTSRDAPPPLDSGDQQSDAQTSPVAKGLLLSAGRRMNDMTSPIVKRAVYPSLKGKRVVITGGSTGIGAGMVEAFAAQDARVIVPRRRRRIRRRRWPAALRTGQASSPAT